MESKKVQLFVKTNQ